MIRTWYIGVYIGVPSFWETTIYNHNIDIMQLLLSGGSTQDLLLMDKIIHDPSVTLDNPTVPDLIYGIYGTTSPSLNRKPIL